MTWSEALAALRDQHRYGSVSAAGLLALADKNGSYQDGNVLVSSDRKRGYRVLELTRA